MDVMNVCHIGARSAAGADMITLKERSPFETSSLLESIPAGSPDTAELVTTTFRRPARSTVEVPSPGRDSYVVTSAEPWSMLNTARGSVLRATNTKLGSSMA